MIRSTRAFSLLAATCLGATIALSSAFTTQATAESLAEARTRLNKEFRNGNFRDAYDGLRKLILETEHDPKLVGADVVTCVQSLRRLGRVNEFDEFVESAIAAHDDNWRLLYIAAQQYLNIDHYGFMISGEYRRGHHRGGGKMVNSMERDRVRALQLMQQAIPLAAKDDNKPDVANFYLSLADQLLYNRGFHEAWRLQYLSDLGELPDFDEGYPRYRNWTGAPVDEAGNPVFHFTVKKWDEAETDGERWRFCLDQVVENNPSRLNEIRMRRAQFCENQFGVQTMAHFGIRFRGGMQHDDGTEDDSGTFALHTLDEDETICRLASGVKRIGLPDEFNHVKIYQQVADDPKTGRGEESVNKLAQICENRRQYPKGAEYWRRSIKEYGPSHNNHKANRVAQITDPWGRFENAMSQPAGKGATIEFRFRNGRQANFSAQKVKVAQLLDDVKAYLKSDPGRPDWQKVNIANLGYRLVQQNETKYLEDEAVAKWGLELEPRDRHFDKRVTVTTPLQKPGAYLLTAKMENGNTSKIIIWVSDTAIVQKQLHGKAYYFVADANSGKPVSKANLEFFGYKMIYRGDRRPQIVTTNFAETADDDGQITPDPRDQKVDFQWLITARTEQGRFAYLGFQRVWDGRYYDADYNATKVFAITDRPVYRPLQSMHFKFWVRHAQYDKDDVSQFANRSFPVTLYSPKGEKLWTKSLQTDEYGGCEGNWEIPEDATLGQYRVMLEARDNRRYLAGGNAMFRVEEYKKPEFEVSIEAPEEPVALGEKIKAKIQAKYYFGSPVTKGTVKYKIQRTPHSQDWFPIMYWDWFYGKGYWWFSYDYPWYPGWSEWVGCVRPFPWWYPRPHAPPELVAENEVKIGEDGTVEIEIDTALAKELHGNTDHKYSITAEVRDESRRTIVGDGQVLVSRKPFKVFTWVNRGYFRVGDVVNANFKAQRLDGKPVAGKGVATLLRISYPKGGDPVETPVRRWKLDAGDEGLAQLQMMASAKGQYRLSYKLTDAADHTIEGGYIFTIIGDGFDGNDFKFNALEIVPEKQEYKPGETVKLQINTNRTDGTVLFFVRPTNGIYKEKPVVMRLKGKSSVQEIAVVKKDMPNFFVEAVTVADGKVFTEVKEIVVPPEKRVLNVEVLPNETEYLPGQDAVVKVKLTELNGEPFVGSTVVSVYDKAVEYISGGSNVGDIKEFFWKWRRRHNVQGQNSLARHFGNLVPKGMKGMNNLGVFGATVADDMDTLEESEEVAMVEQKAEMNNLARARGGMGGGGMMPGAARPMAAMAESAAMDSSDDMAFGAAPQADGTKLAMAGPAKNGQAGGGAAPTAQPTVRTKFADTALWVGALTTEKNGTAEVKLKMPENLTSWKINVWAMGHGTKVGAGSETVVTRKNVILRLQAPRFFVQKDEVVLSANVHNYLKTDKEVTVKLEIPGKQLKALGELTQKVTIPAGGEKRVDWRVSVLDEGEATVRMLALTDEESDAMEMKLPSYVHGMLKMESWAGTIRPDKETAKVVVNVPSERRVEQSVLEVRYSPTLAMAMVDALPYLVDYPYGCTEQTLNRFLPTVVTQKVLLDMNLDLQAIEQKRTNLNAQEIGDDRERAKQWKRYDRNPVFSEEEVRRMVRDGVKRLTNMQNADGGWGWFSGWREKSWPHTTAVVVHGLQTAKQNDVALVSGMLEKGVKWLTNYQNEQVQLLKNAADKKAHKRWKEKANNLDAMIYMILVDADVANDDMKNFLFRDRIDLAVYAKAMYGLSLHKQGDKEKLDMIMSNINQFLVQDEENETAFLKLPADNWWWYWYGSETEANAYYLKLLARLEPEGEEAPRLVKYLLNNRKHATYWANTRDTSVVIEAFADYIRASGEDEPDMTVEVWLDGKKKQEVKVNKDNLFSFKNKFVLVGDEVADGEHEVELRRTGKGPVYFNTYLTNFTLEDQITKAGLEVKVNRKYFKLVPVEKTTKVAGYRGQALDQRVEKYERVELENLSEVVSGDLVEIEMTVDSKNDYEYIIIEDMKAAGFEPVQLTSGYGNNELGAYMEMRDNRVCFFCRRLMRGTHSVSYRMRAEIPGKFSALPTKIYAMYAPELKGNSDEIKLKITDKKE